MELSEKERLILVNQYRILSLLDKDGEEEYRRRIKILQQGFEGLYNSFIIRADIDKRILTNEDTKFVLDVLEMYGSMILSNRKFTNSSLQDSDLYFPGFDTNEEIKFHSLTLFYIQDLDRFNEIEQINKGQYRGIANNVQKYHKMLAKWNNMAKYDLSEENIKDLIHTN